MLSLKRATILGVVLLITLAGVSSSAQVNTESMRMQREKPGLSGNLGVSTEINKGNSDLVQFDIKPSLIWRAGRHQTFSINEISFASSDGDKITNKGFSHLRYNFRWKKRVIPELFAQAQYDKSRDLSERYLGGGGMRFIATERENESLALGLSVMYEREELSSGEITELARNSDYISVEFVSKDRLSFSSTVYVQPALSDLGNVRVLCQMQVAVTVVRGLSLTTELDYHYDSEPPENVKEYDLGLKNGLQLSF